MGRAVILRHALPDGSHHFDLLIGPEGEEPGADADARVLIAWRLPRLPGEGPSGHAADRLPPHRRHYLEYEGPLSGGRGRVLRVARGSAVVIDDDSSSFRARVSLDIGAFEISGTPDHSGSWTLEISPAAAGC